MSKTNYYTEEGLQKAKGRVGPAYQGGTTFYFATNS